MWAVSVSEKYFTFMAHSLYRNCQPDLIRSKIGSRSEFNIESFLVLPFANSMASFEVSNICCWRTTSSLCIRYGPDCCLRARPLWLLAHRSGTSVLLMLPTPASPPQVFWLRFLRFPFAFQFLLQAATALGLICFRQSLRHRNGRIDRTSRLAGKKTGAFNRL